MQHSTVERSPGPFCVITLLVMEALPTIFIIPDPRSRAKHWSERYIYISSTIIVITRVEIDRYYTDIHTDITTSIEIFLVKYIYFSRFVQIKLNVTRYIVS